VSIKLVKLLSFSLHHPRGDTILYYHLGGDGDKKNYKTSFTITNAIKQIESFTKITEVISPNKSTLGVFLKLVNKYKIVSNRIYDAYVTAIAINNDIDIIATDNEKDFKKYKEIKVYNPF